MVCNAKRRTKNHLGEGEAGGEGRGREGEGRQEVWTGRREVWRGREIITGVMYL